MKVFYSHHTIIIKRQYFTIKFILFPLFYFVHRYDGRKLKIGDPTSSETTTGALVSREHLDKVKYYIDLAASEGGKIECGHTVDELQSTLPDKNKNVSQNNSIILFINRASKE